MSKKTEKIIMLIAMNITVIIYPIFIFKYDIPIQIKIIFFILLVLNISIPIMLLINNTYGGE